MGQINYFKCDLLLDGLVCYVCSSITPTPLKDLDQNSWDCQWPLAGVEIALIRLSGLSKNLSGQVDRPTEVIRRTSC